MILILLTPIALIVFFVTRGRRQRRSAADARASIDSRAALDALFAGAPTATYVLSPATLSFEVVVAGAAERGYRLAGRDGQTLVFARN
ncbi:MAG: hypothetical protein QM628_00255 [Propionicimonas sp.]